MATLGVIATKGGIEKTTLNANIGALVAALVADMWLRVLLVDPGGYSVFRSRKFTS